MIGAVWRQLELWLVNLALWFSGADWLQLELRLFEFGLGSLRLQLELRLDLAFGVAPRVGVRAVNPLSSYGCFGASHPLSATGCSLRLWGF